MNPSDYNNFKNTTNYADTLATSVRNARLRLHLTQAELAEIIGVATHTISDIERSQGNPTLSVLGPQIKHLRIDARSIFNPENASQDPVNYAAHQLVNESSKKELDFLMPIVSKILDTLRSDQFKEITEDTSLY